MYYFYFGYVFIFFHFLFFLSFLLTYGFLGFVIEFVIFSFSGVDFSFSFLFDWVSFGFSSVVCLVTSSVFFYNYLYMGDYYDSKRFSYLIFLFVGSMCILIFSCSMLVTMIGWDGLGLVSFLLVIYYGSSYSVDSGLLTVYSNRVGDCMFLFSFSWFYVSGLYVSDVSIGWDFLVFLLFFFGCITKSAQLPFSAWLPAAMAAPTPVSSLVHSSTLVTAGIYVLVRYNFIFFFSKAVMFISIGTMLIAGFGAVIETDFKKVIAMSTLSQLGMMMFMVSVGCWKLCFLHIVLHALFKSLLFLSCGYKMAGLGGSQDSRYFGLVGGPYVGVCFFSSIISLCGLPFSIGFYSKDFILLSVPYGSWGLIFYFIFFVGCFLSVAYSVRLISLGFMYETFSMGFGLGKDSKAFVSSTFYLLFWSVFSGFFFNFYLTDGFVCVSGGFDYSAGLFIFFGGFFFFFFFWLVFYFFFGIANLWSVSMGGVSSNLSFWGFGYSGDLTWLEYMGGKGLYDSFSSFSFFWRGFFYWGFGGLVLFYFFSFFF